MGLHAQMTVRSHRSAWVQGWMVSAVIHAVLVAAVVMGIPAPQVIEIREAFHWEVSLVAPSTATPSDQDAAAPPSSTRSKTFTHARQHANAVQQEAETAVTQQVTVIRSVNTRPVQAVSMPTQLSKAPHKQERRRTEETPVDMRVIEEPKRVEQVRHEAARQEDGVVTEDLRTGESVEASVATSAERVLSQAMPVERVPDLLSPRTRPHTPTSQERVEPAGLRPAAVLAGLLSRSTEGGASQQDQVPNASEADGAEATTPADRAGGNPFVRSSAVRSDYGWLAHTIRARMEEVKRYSIEARVNEWEGKVVISASILADGRIVDIQVVESSGNRRLDEDAKTMVGYVSPLTLLQSIGLAKVTVKVPIIFGLQ